LSNLPPPLLVPCDQDDNLCTTDEVIMMCLAVLLLSWKILTNLPQLHSTNTYSMSL